MGTSSAGTQQNKVLNVDQKAEQRKAEVFGDMKFSESNKRGREEYAQSLRK